MDVIYIAVSAPWKMEMELFVPWLRAERGCGTVADCEKCLGNALNSVSCNWDNAWVNYGDEPAEAEAWPGLVWPWLGCSRHGRLFSTTTTTTTACWNFYEDAGVESSRVEFLGGCRHLNFAALHETYSFWGNFKCHKLLTPVVRRLKLSKTLVRSPFLPPPLSLSLLSVLCVSAIISSGSIGCNWAST